jgi:hypothetical protein
MHVATPIWGSTFHFYLLIVRRRLNSTKTYTGDRDVNDEMNETARNLLDESNSDYKALND